MKTLKTKKVNLFVVYLNTNIKPADYSSAEEMKALIGEVRPAVKDEIKEFIEIQDKIADLQRQLTLGSISQEDANDRVRELNKESQKNELTVGEEVVEVQFENAPFNQLMNFYNRTGKNWFINAERYMEFDKDINKANQEPKEEKK